MKSFAAVGLITLLTLGATSCRGPRLGEKACQEDSDCGMPATAYRCEAETGVCYCRNDDACSGSQFCNPSGFCQDRMGCEKNEDCLASNLLCDTASGTCIPPGRCSSDLQCGLGQICDAKRAACVDGCRSNGDCTGGTCRCGETACSCSGTTAEDRAKCMVGVCDPFFCASSDVCRFGEACLSVPDGGVGRASCGDDYDHQLRPYCDSCTSGGGVTPCGTGPNFCLIDTRNAGNYFCGADCSEGQSCPNGYACQDVIVVLTRWACGANQGCPTNSELPCTQDSDCKRGGFCQKQAGQSSGFCSGVCAVGEGDTVGFCSCQVDADCAQETCGSGGECSISRRKCVNDNDCKTIRCVDFEGQGGCLIGQNCAPADGLSCIEVQRR